MKTDKDSLKLYAVTDRKWLKGNRLEDEVEKAVRSGVTMVQLREKEMSTNDLTALAIKIRDVVHKYNVPLIINDDIDAALASGADGVHLGQEDVCAAEARRRIGNSMILGVSAGTPKAAVEAEKNGADYIGAGAVFPTSTKCGAGLLTIDQLRAICRSVSIPVVAIGGITEENIMSLSGSGISGISVVSAIFGSNDVALSASRLRSLADKIFVRNISEEDLSE